MNKKEIEEYKKILEEEEKLINGIMKKLIGNKPVEVGLFRLIFLRKTINKNLKIMREEYSTLELEKFLKNLKVEID